MKFCRGRKVVARKRKGVETALQTAVLAAGGGGGGGAEEYRVDDESRLGQGVPSQQVPEQDHTARRDADATGPRLAVVDINS